MKNYKLQYAVLKIKEQNMKRAGFSDKYIQQILGKQFKQVCNRLTN